MVGLGLASGCGQSPKTFEAGGMAPQISVVGVGGGGGGGGGANVPVIDLRVDVNRNGTVDLDDPTEDADETVWSATHGAIFLANLDDDQDRCPTATTSGQALTDAQYAGCHDASDSVVNGPDDLLDLARMWVKPWPLAPDSAVGSLELSSPADQHVRLFKSSGGQFTLFNPLTDNFTAAELRAGVELAIEGKDIVRDPAVWNGYLDVTLIVQAPGNPPVAGTDSVRLRVAPVITFHHNLSAEQVFVSRLPGDPDSTRFTQALSDALSQSMVSRPLVQFSEDDPWTEDFFEPAYMSMPAAGGAQHVVRVNFRSANIYGNPTGSRPLRPAGRVVFFMRSKDVAAIQEFDPASDPNMDSLNSMGNTETVPPYTLGSASFPLGRILRGSHPQFYPDRRFSKMLEAQSVQPPIYIDTSWLLVGHVDETLSFLPFDSPRGWIVLVNDPRLARQMLEAQRSAGNGDVPMFVGKRWLDDFGRERDAQVTVSGVLDDTGVMAESAASAAEVDAQLAILRQATGLTDAEVVPIPFLHEQYAGYSLAYQPGTVNALVLNDKFLVMPDPFGPVINGQDIFKEQIRTALAPYGYTVHFVDDWNLYHRNMGEVHCATNTARAIPAAKWWEGGR
ncbi:MAG: protein-arginine deiminase family protein [Myxococcota bacterium]